MCVRPLPAWRTRPERPAVPALVMYATFKSLPPRSAAMVTGDGHARRPGGRSGASRSMSANSAALILGPDRGTKHSLALRENGSEVLSCNNVGSGLTNPNRRSLVGAMRIAGTKPGLAVRPSLRVGNVVRPSTATIELDQRDLPPSGPEVPCGTCPPSIKEVRPSMTRCARACMHMGAVFAPQRHPPSLMWRSLF